MAGTNQTSCLITWAFHLASFWTRTGELDHTLPAVICRDDATCLKLIAPELTPVPTIFSRSNLLAGWGSDMPVRTGEILKVNLLRHHAR